MNEAEPVSARMEWRRHWKVVAASMGGTSIGAIPSYMLGLFIHPLEQAFGWSRAGISSALLIYSIVGVIGAPFAGILVDRLGSRRIALFGATVYFLFTGLLSLISSDIHTWWAAWILLGLAGLCTKPTVWSKAVTSFFHKGRGVALAMMASGVGIASSVLPIVSNAYIERLGWRWAFVAVALTFTAIVLPLLWFWFFDSSDKPTGADTRTKAERLQSLPGWTAREGLRKRQTYQIAVAAMLGTGVVTAFAVHIISMLTASGVARGEAVGLFGMVGVLAVASRLIVGVIFDRVEHPAVGVLSIGLPVIPALALLFMPPGMEMAIVAVVTLGIAIGGEYDAVIYLGSRFFGLKAFGFLFGLVASVMLLGIGLGPVIAGRIYDVYRSYDLFYMLVIPASLISSLLVGTLGRYPDHSAESRA